MLHLLGHSVQHCWVMLDLFGRALILGLKGMRGDKWVGNQAAF